MRFKHFLACFFADGMHKLMRVQVELFSGVVLHHLDVVPGTSLAHVVHQTNRRPEQQTRGGRGLRRLDKVVHEEGLRFQELVAAAKKDGVLVLQASVKLVPVYVPLLAPAQPLGGCVHARSTRHHVRAVPFCAEPQQVAAADRDAVPPRHPALRDL